MAGQAAEFFPKVDRNATRPEPVRATPQAGTAKKDGAPAKDAKAFVSELKGVEKNPVLRASTNEIVKSAPAPKIKNQGLPEKTSPVPMPEIQRVPMSGAKQQAAVADFMSEMQSKFGVTPEELVGAFVEMDEDTLKGRPEDAMGQFLAALQLTPQQQDEAARLYQNLVQETGDSALNEKLGADKPVVNFQILNAREQRTMRLRDSLDAMNDNFFRRGAFAPVNTVGNANPLATTVDSELAALAPKGPPGMVSQSLSRSDFPSEFRSELSPEMSEGGGKNDLSAAREFTAPENPMAFTDQAGVDVKRSDDSGDDDGASLSLLRATPLALAGSAGAVGVSAVGATATGAELSESVDALGVDQPYEFSSDMPVANSAADAVTEQLTDSWAQDGNSDFTQGGADSEPFTQSGQQAAQSNFSSAMQGAAAASVPLGKFALSKGAESKGTDADTKTGIEAATSLAAGAVISDRKGTQPLTPDAMMMRQPQPTQQQQTENIQELIRQAQVIMKRGGGEMKLKLQPEGMGEVNLKVAVLNGQVNVQMITETDGAKKLLENGLTDLKNELAAHKLHVETLKVDLAGEAAHKKFDSQGHSDPQREQARQFAGDFLGQFREDRQAFRQAFGDDQGFRSYNRDQKRAPVEAAPVETSGTTQAKSQVNSRRDGSRRLNLLA